jgi:serine protease Do
VVEAVEAVAPAVVSITTQVPQTDFFYQTRTDSSEGSGVVIDASGVVLTNDHVIRGANRITATFADGQSFPADLVGTAPELDLAVLRIRSAPDNPPLTAVEVGASGELLLGEPVIAIGNPFGLGHTVTTGVISAVSRPLETDDRVYQDFIQTDASINPGNSGGPLLDVTGRLIGINTAIRPDAEGIGFAIPVDRAVKVARDLIQFGTVQVPWLGMDLEDIAVRSPTGRRVAVRVVQVFPDSPADRAGIQTGDLLLGIDGRELHGRADLNAHLAAFDPGRDFRIERARSGKRSTLQVSTTPLPDSAIDRSIEVVLGVRLSDTPDQRGVRVQALAPEGSLARQGLRVGDRILGVNGQPTPTVEALRTQLGRVKSGHRAAALFTIQRRTQVGRISAAL